MASGSEASSANVSVGCSDASGNSRDQPRRKMLGQKIWGIHMFHVWYCLVYFGLRDSRKSKRLATPKASSASIFADIYSHILVCCFVDSCGLTLRISELAQEE